MSDQSNSLVIFSKAALMLAEADTIQKAKELKDMSIVAGEWAKRKGMGEAAILHCQNYAFEAECRMGELLKQTERAKAGRPPKSVTPRNQLSEQPTLASLGITKRESVEAQACAKLPESAKSQVRAGKVSKAKAIRQVRARRQAKALNSIAAQTPPTLEGRFDVIVLDPPWPMKKLPRDCRPNQAALDYPLMTVDEIRGMKTVVEHAAENCHVFLWTTHRFLPAAFDCLKAWGADYSCTFVWHKPGGFQPVGLPQFNCEFCLYARIGKPQFMDTKDFNLCFDAQRGKHSEKPGAFFNTIRRVTAGRRLDAHNRRKIEGFVGGGKEAK